MSSCPLGCATRTGACNPIRPGASLEIVPGSRSGVMVSEAERATGTLVRVALGNCAPDSLRAQLDSLMSQGSSDWSSGRLVDP